MIKDSWAGLTVTVAEICSCISCLFAKVFDGSGLLLVFHHQVTERCTLAFTFLLADSVEGVTVTEDTDITGNGGTAQTRKTGGSLPHTVRPDSVFNHTHWRWWSDLLMSLQTHRLRESSSSLGRRTEMRSTSPMTCSPSWTSWPSEMDSSRSGRRRLGEDILYFSCLLLYSSVMIFKFLRGPSCLPLLRTSPLHFSVPGTKSFFVQDKPLFVQGLSSECWRCSSRTSSGFYSDIFKSYNSCVSSLSSCFRAGVQLNCFRVMLTKTDLIWAQAWNKD